MSRRLSVALVFVLSAASHSHPARGADQVPAPPAPGQAQPTFPSAVEVVTVDVAVVDRKGKAVAGLTRDDFVVSDEGKPQTVTSFEAVVIREPAPGAPAPAAPRRRYSSNVTPETPRARTFVIVFDDVHLTPVQALRAKGVVGEFLQSGVADGDRVLLVATGGAAWWNARMPAGREQLLAILKRLDGRYFPDSSPDRMTEWEAMRIEEYQDPQVADKVQRRFDNYGAMNSQKDPRGVKPGDAYTSAPAIFSDLVRSRAQEVHNLATSRNKVTLGVMQRAIESVAGIRGRKAMVLVSQGFVYDIQVAEMRKVVEASTRSNVPIYFIDTRGLQALPEAFTAAFGRPLEAQDTVAVLADITLDADGSASLALDTGGFVVKNSNDLASGINRVSAESRAYYLLGYNPGNVPRDGKFRRIEVKLRDRRKDLSVRARRGYYAPSDVPATPAARPPADPAIQAALDSPFDRPEVPLRVSAFTFDESMHDRMSVTVAAEVDVRDLAFKEEEGRSKDSLALLVEAQHRETGEYYRNDQTVEMSLLPDTRSRLARTWYPVSAELTLPPGGYQVKVVARDLGSGRVGSVIHDFEVPESGTFRVSTPLLSDAVATDAEGVKRPVLQVRRSFAPDAVLYCQFSVYGAARDEKGTLMPRVRAGYEVRRVDGTAFKRGPFTLITPTSVGSLQRLNGISLKGAAAGAYELVLTVKDELAGKSVEVREPFEIEAG